VGAASQTKGAAAANNVGLHDRMARYLYMMEVLRGRSGTLAGKFRLDIAPGTTVYIRNVGEQIIGDLDLAATDLWATVKTVQIGLDSEESQAATVFELAHIRTPEENTNDRTSIASHPLYLNQVYKGAPLVDEYLFF
jgi:hypothetical protein